MNILSTFISYFGFVMFSVQQNKRLLTNGLAIIALTGLVVGCGKTTASMPEDLTGSYALRLGESCTVPPEEEDQVFLKLNKNEDGHYTIELSPKITSRAGFPSSGSQIPDANTHDLNFLLEDNKLSNISMYLTITPLDDTYIELSKWDVITKSFDGNSTLDLLEKLGEQAIKAKQQDIIFSKTICLANIEHDPYSVWGYVPQNLSRVTQLADIDPQSIGVNMSLTSENCPIGYFEEKFSSHKCRDVLPQAAAAQAFISEERRKLKKTFSGIEACLLEGKGAVESCENFIQGESFDDPNQSEQDEYGDEHLTYYIDVPEVSTLRFDLSAFYYGEKVYWRNIVSNFSGGCKARALCEAFDPNLIYSN